MQIGRKWILGDFGRAVTTVLLCVLLDVFLSVFLDGKVARAQAREPQLEGAELVTALKAGGLVILMRHMSTDTVVPEDGAHADQDCLTQRNLDDQGKLDAVSVGRAVKSLEIPIGEVMTSPYCRCVDTGMLVFGKANKLEELAVFDVLSAPEKEDRAKLIRLMLNTVPASKANTVLITHTGTLLYTFGLQTRPEGIAHVFRPAEFGPPAYLGRVTPEQWGLLARSAATGG